MVSVHLGYAAGDFHALLDGEPYLPEETWHISTKAEFYSTVTEEQEVKSRRVIEAITVGRGSKSDAKVTLEPKTGLARRVG